MIIPTEAYPLRWPAGALRTSTRRRSAFVNCQIGREVADVLRQLRLLAAKTIVISSNLPLRSDGVPSADAPARPNGDSGIAVYWTRNERRGGRWSLMPYCIPCDRWDRIADNLHAVALSIEAMRGMERWGAVTIEQAFSGFAALPPGANPAPTGERPWREVIGGPWPELEPVELLAIARARHRKLIAVAHPDAGGDPTRAAELNAALAAAEQELSK